VLRGLTLSFSPAGHVGGGRIWATKLMTPIAQAGLRMLTTQSLLRHGYARAGRMAARKLHQEFQLGSFRERPPRASRNHQSRLQRRDERRAARTLSATCR